MSLELLNLTEKTIEDGFEHRNAPLLQKEALFLMHNYAMNMSEEYAEIIDFIKPFQVKLKTESNFLFQSPFKESLYKILDYSQRITERKVDWLEAKSVFDTWFYDVTVEGILVCQYNDASDTLSMKDAAAYLGVSRTMLYKYVDRGLETVGAKNNQCIPKFVLDAWKNPALAFNMQWSYQQRKQRSMSLKQRLETINEQIAEFESEYGNTFNALFGQLSALEIDEHNESVDILDWKELEYKKNNLLRFI